MPQNDLSQYSDEELERIAQMSAYSDEELEKLASNAKPSTLDLAGEYAAKIGKPILKGLTYAGDVVASPVKATASSGVQFAMGDIPLTKAITQVPADIASTLIGKTPDYLARHDPKGRVRKENPNLYKTLDAVSDVSAGYLSPIAMAKGAEKTVGGVSRIFGGKSLKTVKNGWERAFKSTFKEADQISRMSKVPDKALPSDVAWKYRDTITGTAEDIREGVVKKLDDLTKERESLINLVDDTGVEANLSKAAEEVRNKISKWKTPGRESGVLSKKQAADLFEEGLNDTINFAQPVGNKGVGLRGTLDLKTSQYGKLGDQAYDALSKTQEGDELIKTFAHGLRKESENVASKAVPGSGKELSRINKEIGALLELADPATREALKESRKLALTEVDFLLLPMNPIATGTKQIGKAIKSPWVKTTLGKAGYKLSNNLGKVGGTGAFLNLLPEEKPLLDLTQ